MNIHIHRQYRDLATALDAQIASGIQRTLGQLAARVGDVTVHLRAAHGSGGDVLTHCRILAALPSPQMVIVESLHADQTEAIAQASVRLARAVHDQFAESGQLIARAQGTNRIASTMLFRRRTSVTALTTGDQSKDSQSPHIST
jgi:hypothetical protein